MLVQWKDLSVQLCISKRMFFSSRSTMQLYRRARGEIGAMLCVVRLTHCSHLTSAMSAGDLRRRDVDVGKISENHICTKSASSRIEDLMVVRTSFFGRERSEQRVRAENHPACMYTRALATFAHTNRRAHPESYCMQQRNSRAQTMLRICLTPLAHLF